MGFKILGTGSFLPPRVVGNDEMKRFFDTSDEWITQRVGIKERRVCTTETTTDIAYKAAEAALEMSGVRVSELEIIICATVSADFVTPSLACSLQSMLGADCPAFDINAACSGFIYALDVAAGFFARGAEKILVVGAERLTRVLDWTDRSTCVIFADGAGAMVLGQGDSYLSSKLHARGGDTVLSIPNFCGDSPFYQNEAKKTCLFMNGQETFKFAVKAMSADFAEVIAAAGLRLDEVDWFIPHQANLRIIEAAGKRLGIPPQRLLINIEKVGNTSAASVAILADELFRSGNLRDGDIIAMSSFGAGLTSAACVIKWEP